MGVVVLEANSSGLGQQPFLGAALLSPAGDLKVKQHPSPQNAHPSEEKLWSEERLLAL